MTDVIAPKKRLLRQFLFFLKFLEIRLRFVAILVITAFFIGYWDHVQNHYERWQRNRAAHDGMGTAAPGQTEPEAAESQFEYFCGMHPFVVRDRQGKCPICGMALTQREKGAPVELPEGALARVQTSPERIMQAGVQVEPVAYRLLSHTVRSYGAVEAAETRVAKIVARFPGRVEELMVNATGIVVKKGEPLTRIYSPNFLTGSEQYMLAIANQRKLDADPQAGAEDKRRAEQMVAASRQRLVLAGFTTEQLEMAAQNKAGASSITLYSPLSGTVIEKSVLLGETVEEGTTLYTIADLSSVWVQVRVIESDIAAVKLGMPVEVTSVSWPGVIFYGTVDFIYPTLDTENRSVKVRVAVVNTDGNLKPGMYVNAVVRSPAGQFGEVASFSATTAASAPAPVDHADHDAGPAEMPKTITQFPTKTQADADAHLATLAPGAEYFICPMDPQAVSDKQDDCPICGMHLEKQQKAETPQGSDERWAEGYACSMHPDELSDKPGICTTCGCGMTLNKYRVERVLAVPESAVIDTGTRKVVYVESAPGVYDAYAVTLGSRAGAYYPVLAGLSAGQRIATRGSFLIDAEARLNPAISGITAATAAPGAAPAHQHGGG